MDDVKWIRLVVNIFDSRKIKQIEKMPEGDTIIVIWLKLLCLAGTCNKNGMLFLTDEIAYTEDSLATEFNMDSRLNILRIALRVFEQFKMIETVDNVFYICNWEKYQNIEGLDRIREQTRLRVAKCRDNKKQLLQCNVTCNDTVTQSNETEKEIESDKDIENISLNNIVQSDKNSNPKKADIDAFFEQVWKVYPNKKGKAQVSDAKKKVLYQIGYEHLERAITRYQSELKKETWRQMQNGSTFFNSGYVDYLDNNFIPNDKPVIASKQNSFNQFQQRTYTENEYIELERKLLNKNL
jgi:predicted phage replisome organizer